MKKSKNRPALEKSSENPEHSDSKDHNLDAHPLTEDLGLRTQDSYWMRLALAEAEKAAALGEVPVGAVAVYEGKIIGRGINRKERDLDPTAHAEMIALREAAAALQNWRLLGVTLYCTLEPCPMCAGAMIQARLPRLVYGAPDTRFGADGSIVDLLKRTPEGQSLFNHQVEVTRGVLAEEAAAQLQRFFRQLRSQ